MDLNVVLPLLSSVLAFGFAAMVADQWIRRRQPYQLVWTIGLLWFGIAAGTEALGGAVGWNEPLYRIWYLVGAIWVAGWLGLGFRPARPARPRATGQTGHDLAAEAAALGRDAY